MNCPFLYLKLPDKIQQIKHNPHMKFTEKLYKWFYQGRSRTIANIINGASTGLLIWIFGLIFDRLIGVNGTFYWYLPHFVTGGMVIGAIIGMISNEVFLHKGKNGEHTKKE